MKTTLIVIGITALAVIYWLQFRAVRRIAERRRERDYQHHMARIERLWKYVKPDSQNPEWDMLRGELRERRAALITRWRKLTRSS